MSAPSPCYVTQTPQREFAGAKVQQKNEICKKICTFDADLLFLLKRAELFFVFRFVFKRQCWFLAFEEALST